VKYYWGVLRVLGGLLSTVLVVVEGREARRELEAVLMEVVELGVPEEGVALIRRVAEVVSSRLVSSRLVSSSLNGGRTCLSVLRVLRVYLS